MREKTYLKIVKFCILGFFFSASLLASTYYIDGTNGNDANLGRQRTSALKTIQKTVAKLQAGDSCIVLGGSYNERITIQRPGRAETPTVFLAEGRVIVRGFTIEADYIHIIGFEISETADDWKEGAGIFVFGKNCELRNNHIHDVSRSGILLYAESPNSAITSGCLVHGNIIERAGTAGITVMGQNHQIEANDISHSLQCPPGCKEKAESADADGIRFFGSGHVFRKNHIHDILLSDPGNTDPHIDCFQTWGPAFNIVFEQNICDNPNDGMQGFMISSTTSPVADIIIRNNIISAFRPINAWNCERLYVLNNSFKSELFYRIESGYGIELHNSPNARIYNNLFFDIGRHVFPYLFKDGNSDRGLEVAYNCVYMSDGLPPKGNPWPHDLWQVNPRVQNGAEKDFRLTPESPLIDTGMIIEITNDFDGKPRPKGMGMDIGAFEYQSPAPPDSLVLKIP